MIEGLIAFAFILFVGIGTIRLFIMLGMGWPGESEEELRLKRVLEESDGGTMH